MSEIIIILGAGASTEAGAPTMSDFLDKADELRREGKADDFKDDFDKVFEAISLLQPVHSKAKLDLDNIESIFAAFEMGRLIGKLGDKSKEEIEALLISIKILICKTLEMTIKYPVRDREVIWPNESYNSLVRLIYKINKEGRENRCTILTFNYDLALDYACHFNRYPIDYCIESETKENKIPIMKLHGSVNWLMCNKCSKIVPWYFDDFFKKFSFDRISLRESPRVNIDVFSKFPMSDLKCCDTNFSTFIPFIVPPTWNKTEHYHAINSVWSHAAQELSDAENIFISGYSLTETDSFFRYLFALGSVGMSKIKRFWVYDPDDSGLVEKRFKDLIGFGIEKRFRFEKKHFSKLVNELSNELK